MPRQFLVHPLSMDCEVNVDSQNGVKTSSVEKNTEIFQAHGMIVHI